MHVGHCFLCSRNLMRQLYLPRHACRKHAFLKLEAVNQFLQKKTSLQYFISFCLFLPLNIFLAGTCAEFVTSLNKNLETKILSCHVWDQFSYSYPSYCQTQICCEGERRCHRLPYNVLLVHLFFRNYSLFLFLKS